MCVSKRTEWGLSEQHNGEISINLDISGRHKNAQQSEACFFDFLDPKEGPLKLLFSALKFVQFVARCTTRYDFILAFFLYQKVILID